MADSALEAVTEYVQELLEDSEAAALKDLTVLWGPPLGDDTPLDLISVGFGPDGDSGDSDREWGPIGGKKLDEEFSLNLMCQSAGMDGTDLKAAYTRSFAIAAAVETEIRSDLTLGGLLTLMPAKVGRWRGRYFRHDQTRGHRVFQTLSGSARI